MIVITCMMISILVHVTLFSFNVKLNKQTNGHTFTYRMCICD